MTHTNKTGREYIYTLLNTLLFCSFSSHPVLGTTLLILLPAMLYGCSAEFPDSSAEQTATAVSITKSPGADVKTLDIFVFADDEMRLLDCYQRIERPEKWDMGVVSGYGDRIMFLCANSGMDAGEWPWIRSWHSLEKIVFNLEDECPDSPVMTGIARISPKNDSHKRAVVTEAILRPLSSEIVLRSVRCDFTGRPYDGEKITDAKVYLTNVNAEAGLLDEDGMSPRRIINSGHLNSEDIAAFPDSSMIVRHLSSDIGKKVMLTDIHLYCYPNTSEEESPGTPVTRLVLEGKVGGTTYYWPININRRQGKGVERGRSYVFDIVITRKGTDDPDIPVETDEVEIIITEEEWNEKEDYTVGF